MQDTMRASAVRAEVRTITPEDAEQLLAKNTHNRNISAKRVEQYARALIRGDWQLNGDAIRIAEDGTLIDGQHRVLAVLEAGEPMTTLVVTGLPKEAQETVDTGRARTFGDMLKLRGELHSTGLAAAVRGLHFYLMTGRPERSGNDNPSAQELFATLEEHPSVRDAVYTVGNKQSRVAFIGTAGGLATLLYLFRSVDEEDANTFLHHLLTGEELSAGNPIYHLRERLLKEAQIVGGANKMRSIVKLALTVKAFNAWRNGETISNLSWRPGGAVPERFPLIEKCPFNPRID